MKEIWKDIPGYEGYYQASNLGRIKSLSIYVGNKYRNGLLFKQGRIMKYNINKRGYCSLTLSRLNIKRLQLIHRLVISSFIPNIQSKKQVNHKDGNPSNNKLSNLERCTSSENCLHAFNVLGNVTHNKGKIGSDCFHSKKVFQYNVKGKLIKVWNCLADIERRLGYKQQGISAVCRGERKFAYNFIWLYKKNENIKKYGIGKYLLLKSCGRSLKYMRRFM